MYTYHNFLYIPELERLSIKTSKDIFLQGLSYLTNLEFVEVLSLDVKDFDLAVSFAFKVKSRLWQCSPTPVMVSTSKNLENDIVLFLLTF